MLTHETEEIVIKKAEVDKGIVPIVNWLNSFNGIYTRYSCELGTTFITLPKFDFEDKYFPHVIFYCDHQIDLREVAYRTRNFAVIIAHYYEFTAGLRYQIVFHSSEYLKRFISEVLKEK